MELSSEQLQYIKEQLIQQINSSFPEDKKQEYLSQIDLMNDEELIDFLEQNNLIKTDSEQKEQKNCIFCSIIFGDIPSTKIAENEKALAILELNPISEGHTLIIPKNHLESIEEIDDLTSDLAKIISDKLKRIFNPKEIQIIPSEFMGHAILNVLPIYTNETMNSSRKKNSPEDLKILQEKILTPYQEKVSEPEKNKKIEISEKEFKLPKRIP